MQGFEKIESPQSTRDQQQASEKEEAVSPLRPEMKVPAAAAARPAESGESSQALLCAWSCGPRPIHDFKPLRPEWLDDGGRKMKSTVMPLLAAGLALWGTAPPLAAQSGPDDYVIPEGTEFKLMLHTEINSKTAREGDRILASVFDPVYAYDEVVLPKSTRVEGHINDVAPAEFRGRGGYLTITFNAIELSDGEKVPIVGSLAEIFWNEDHEYEDDVYVGLDGNLRGRGPSRLLQTAMVAGAAATGGMAGVGVGVAAGVGGLFGAIFVPQGHEAVLGAGSVVGMRLDRDAFFHLTERSL